MSTPQDDEREDAIEQSVASGIKRVQGDQGTVEEHSLTERIEADKYLRAKRAASRGIGVRLVKLIPPGAT